MAATQTNLTRHDLAVAGAEMSASMMLSEATGEGHVMFSTSQGPAFSIATQRIPELLGLLIEAEAIYTSMKRLPDELTVDDIVQPPGRRAAEP